MSLNQPIVTLVRAAAEKLAAAGNTTAKLDTEFLMAHILGCERAGLYTFSRDLSKAEQNKFDRYVEQRLTGEPVAYVLGEQAFWTLDLKVNEHTLIPRPDTETLVEAVLSRTRNSVPETILDLGTGSGCILLSLLSELKSTNGLGVDISSGALAVAMENATANGMLARTAFETSDWFSKVDRPDGGFSVIVSNPPYIPEADIKDLMPDVQNFEPLSALEGGPDGLGPYRIIADEAGAYLTDSGLVAVEVGIHQAEDVVSLFSTAGFINIEKHKDLAGIERVVSAINHVD
ncbi:MAG: peptide chain release factor N(5)-glutamine methyltransferase [Kordiimonadaceae bacterium]|nr:peptide chain release factor N(5)-glutamine methyltransferase [Kordiimonadaceae bacterium]